MEYCTLAKPAPVTADPDVVDHGRMVYQRHCSYCHGDGMRTGGLTPDLRYANETTHENWDAIVLDGRREMLGMVGFREFLDEKDSEAIRQYTLFEAARLYEEQQKAKAKSVANDD